MNAAAHPPAETLLLADVGNTRIKLAVVAERGRVGPTAARLPRVDRRQDLLSRDFRLTNLERWLAAVAPGPALLLVASVNDTAAARLGAAIAEVSATGHRPLRQRRIGHADLPLAVQLDEPQRVGIDRLASAAAAGSMSSRSTPSMPAVSAIAARSAAEMKMISMAVRPGCSASASRGGWQSRIVPRAARRVRSSSALSSAIGSPARRRTPSRQADAAAEDWAGGGAVTCCGAVIGALVTGAAGDAVAAGAVVSKPTTSSSSGPAAVIASPTCSRRFASRR